MEKIIIKKWIGGEFLKVREFSIEEVKQIRHHKNGLELVLNGNIQLFDEQCIIEFS